MTSRKDLYEILGVGRNATDKEIKSAYRKLAKKYHPDTNPGDKNAEEKFREVSDAYAVLGDPEKRKKYDQFGDAAFQEGFGEAGYGNPFEGFYSGRTTDPNGSYQEFHFNGENMGSMFDDLFGGMFGGKSTGGFHSGSSFHSGGGFQNAGFGFDGMNAHSGGSVNLDAESDITVSFEDAAFGAEKRIRLNDVSGSASSLQIHIPAGIGEGQKIRLKGKGNRDANGNQGDLFLRVHIAPKAGFERKGQNLFTTAEIPFTTAVFGGEAMVPTLTGKVLCKIAPGTQSGSKIRLKGKGIVFMQEPKKYGDEYVTIRIEVPKYLTPEERRKLKEYQEVSDKNKADKNGRGHVA